MQNYLFKILFSLMILGIYSAACQRESEPSTVSFAHKPAYKSAVSPIGWLTVKELDFPNSLAEKYLVCVRTGEGSIKPESLLLETKMSYAAWLSAAGYGQEAW